MLTTMIKKLGAIFIDTVISTGKSGIILFNSIFILPRSIRSFSLLIKQLYSVGVLSLLIMVVSGLFIGMVLSLQGYTILTKFGGESALGPLVALSLFRELGPVVAALLFAGRAGSALTAEIGLMKATEQLTSLEMMAINPVRQIIAPRFWAGIISLPLLTIVFNGMGIFGGHLVGVDWLGVDDGGFWASMQSAVDWYADVINGIIKSIVFAFVVTWIAVFRGFNSEPTSEGISIATTQTVVHSSLAILGLDFILTLMMFGEI